jgi:hypothetical protein
MKTFLRITGLIALLLPAAAIAQGAINEAVNSVSGNLPTLIATGYCTGGGACGFVEIAAGVVSRFRPILTIVGALVIVIYGYRMIVGQEDDVVTKARVVMSGTISGLVMVYLIDPFIMAFYGRSGEVPQGAMQQGVAVLTAELNGIINWALVIVATISITMIVLTALKAFGQATGEEGIANMRKTIVSVIFGILLLVFRVILSEYFVLSTQNPSPIMAAVLRPVSYVMSFLALAAVMVVVYAGFLCVLSNGNEENFTKAKGLLIRAAIGMIVIFISLALVNFVILPGLQ